MRWNRNALRSQGVQALYVFGSVARGQATSASDVDVMIDIDPNSHFNLVDLVGLRRQLSQRLGTRVDVVTGDSLHRRIRNDVLSEAVRVF